jgi:hypothetical protein
MIELEDHCNTHILPRLQKVVQGTDLSGVSKATNWQGGGGFRYFKLAPSLLETDKWGREVISKAYNAEMLAEALCKIEGFAYAPSDAVYWQHGHSTERDFVYVTTQTLGVEQLQQLSEEVGPDRSAGAVFGLQRQRGSMAEPHGQEDSEPHPVTLRMGPRRLQFERRKSAQDAAEVGAGGDTPGGTRH